MINIPTTKIEKTYEGQLPLRDKVVNELIDKGANLTGILVMAKAENKSWYIPPTVLVQDYRQSSKPFEDKFSHEKHFIYYYQIEKATPCNSTGEWNMLCWFGDWYPMLRNALMSKEVQSVMNQSMAPNVLPKVADWFKAYELSPFWKTRAVILGQDPYHDGSATGLAFANKITQEPKSPSLLQIEAALKQKGLITCFDYTMEHWANQGTLMLNSCLTVQQGMPNSMKGKGWEKLIQATVEALNTKQKVHWFLWGTDAQKWEPLISPGHKKYKESHPASAAYNKSQWEGKTLEYLETEAGVKLCEMPF